MNDQTVIKDSQTVEEMSEDSNIQETQEKPNVILDDITEEKESRIEAKIEIK